MPLLSRAALAPWAAQRDRCGAEGAAEEEAPCDNVLLEHRLALECVERASDGEATHRVELRGDGRHVDPDAR